MKLENYQALAMRTSTEDHDRVENGCLGLIGESGEIVDAIKKWRFQSGKNPPLPVDKLVDECGDALWYCAELATGLNESLYSLYETLKDNFELEVRPVNLSSTVTELAVHLSMAAAKPYDALYEGGNEPEGWKAAKAKACVVGIMVMVRDLLEQHCGSTLEEAMERNIEKLRQRYPDGFDAERSLKRG